MNLGPQTPSGGWRAITGSICRLREACLSTPQPLRHRVPCVPFVGAGYPRCSRPTRSRTTGLVRWYPLGQLEEELDPVARTGDQVVEVIPLHERRGYPAAGALSLAGAPAGQHLVGRCLSDGRMLSEV